MSAANPGNWGGGLNIFFWGAEMSKFPKGPKIEKIQGQA